MKPIRLLLLAVCGLLALLWLARHYQAGYYHNLGSGAGYINRDGPFNGTG